MFKFRRNAKDDAGGDSNHDGSGSSQTPNTGQPPNGPQTPTKLDKVKASLMMAGTYNQGQQDAIQTGTVPKPVKVVATREDWKRISIANQDWGLVGQPTPKPVTHSPNHEATERINRRISTNIRRRRIIICMLLFFYLLTWDGMYDLFMKINLEKESVFSVIVLKPWLVPLLACEMIFSALGIITITFKLKYTRKKCVRKLYRYTMGFNGFQTLLFLLVTPILIFVLSTQVTAKMKSQLTPGNVADVKDSWKVTQMQRKCCGIHSRADWVAVDYYKANITARKPILYPKSCCNQTIYNKNDDYCSETNIRLVWRQGCHDVEFYVVLDYSLATMALLILTFALNISIKIGIFRLERYLMIFRPREICC